MAQNMVSIEKVVKDALKRRIYLAIKGKKVDDEGMFHDKLMDTGKPVSFIFFNLEQRLFLCSIDPVSVQLFGGPGLGVGLVDGVFDNNIWEKTGVTCHAGEQYLHSHTRYIFGTS